MVAFLPAPIAYGVALFRSDIQFRLSGDQRRQIKYSLELLFGNRYSPQQRDQIARDCIRNVSCQAIDAVRLLGNGKALLGEVEVRGKEHLREALARGANIVESSEEAQDKWVRTLRETAIDLTQIQRECTPGYYNNEGSKTMRWYLGEYYGPGWDAFEQLMQDWRDKGTMEGLVLETDQ